MSPRSMRATLIGIGVLLLVIVFWPREVTELPEVSETFPYTFTVTPTAEPVVDEDQLWLAKIMAAESGPNWPDAFTMMIGEVVLNRVESPDWPNSIQAVLTQIAPIQYAPVHSGTWDKIIPTDHQMELARRLLDGERVLCDKDVVYQALFEQGDVTVATYYDSDLDTTTYFCKEEN